VRARSVQGKLIGEVLVPAATPDDPGARRARLALVRDWNLEVEVVDEASRPVPRISVTFVRPHESKGSQTDDRGRVVFRHAGLELARARGQTLEVRADVLLAEPVRAMVDREPPPGQPLRLVVPARGALEVRVIGDDGQPFEKTAFLTLDVVSHAEPGRAGMDSPRNERVSATHAGAATFEDIGLGQQLELTAEYREGNLRTKAVLDGPRVPGERVAHTLQLAVDRTVLVFRAVDETGKALVGELEVKVGVSSNHSSGSSAGGVRTDDEGRFESCCATNG
jgi:hypothetical protein